MQEKREAKITMGARTLITHNYNGQMNNEPIRSKINSIDNGGSHTYGHSTFTRYVDGHQIETKPKCSDDKVITGYNSQGLPFQIIVDGFFNSSTRNMILFIDNTVVPLMNEYAHVLSDTENFEQVTRALIKEKIKAKIPPCQDIQFTMSIVNTYQKNGKIYAAGFGVGDTAIVCKRNGSGEIMQLVSNTLKFQQRDGNRDLQYKDGFSDSIIIDETLVDYFNTELNVGDELVGYTHIPQSMEVKESLPSTTDTKGWTTTIYKSKLNASGLEKESSAGFFQQIVDSISKHHDTCCVIAEQERQTITFGDDCTVAGITVPSPELQLTLKQDIEIAHIKDATKQYLDWMNNNAQGLRLSHIYHGSSGVKRAESIWKMIEDKSPYRDIINAVHQALSASGSRKYSYSRYLVGNLFPQTNVLDSGMNDSDFKRIKNTFSTLRNDPSEPQNDKSRYKIGT